MRLIIYGANGYTARLIIERALEHGLRPLLSGRDPLRIARIAASYGLEHQAAAVDDPVALARLLRAPAVVLNCAGPFAHTAQPLVQACLRAGVHYLDITGEIGVFEALAAQDAAARAARIMVLPGVGFDVVPSDCLALHVQQRLPGANRLRLGFLGLGGMSRGTASTMLLAIQQGQAGLIREAGRLRQVPLAHRQWQLQIDGRAIGAVTIPWGDVATAYYSTGIPDIEVYMALPRRLRRLLPLGRLLTPLLRLPPLYQALLAAVRRGEPGPDAQARANGRSLLWAEAQAPDAARVFSILRCPEPYSLTAQTAVLIADNVLRGNYRPGFQTPARAYGADLILRLPGVERVDQPAA